MRGEESSSEGPGIIVIASRQLQYKPRTCLEYPALALPMITWPLLGARIGILLRLHALLTRRLSG